MYAKRFPLGSAQMTNKAVTYSESYLENVIERMIDTATRKESTSFRELVEAAGLSPSEDFVHASLADLDLRGQDLRGFDFSEADLSGADLRGANLLGVPLWNA